MVIPCVRRAWRSSRVGVIPRRLSRQGQPLKQPEDFEDDHNNDNHSNYVKDVSAHVGDSYQIARAMVNGIRREGRDCQERALSLAGTFLRYFRSEEKIEMRVQDVDRSFFFIPLQREMLLFK